MMYRSKPALSYTRCHRVPFDTVHIDPFARPVDMTSSQSEVARLTAIVTKETARFKQKFEADMMKLIESFKQKLIQLVVPQAT